MDNVPYNQNYSNPTRPHQTYGDTRQGHRFCFAEKVEIILKPHYFTPKKCCEKFRFISLSFHSEITNCAIPCCLLSPEPAFEQPESKKHKTEPPEQDKLEETSKDSVNGAIEPPKKRKFC